MAILHILAACFGAKHTMRIELSSIIEPFCNKCKNCVAKCKAACKLQITHMKSINRERERESSLHYYIYYILNALTCAYTRIYTYNDHAHPCMYLIACNFCNNVIGKVKSLLSLADSDHTSLHFEVFPITKLQKGTKILYETQCDCTDLENGWQSDNFGIE